MREPRAPLFIVLLSAIGLACGPSILLPAEEGSGTSDGSTGRPGSVTSTVPPDTTSSATMSTTLVTTSMLDTGDESAGGILAKPDEGGCRFAANSYGWCDIFAQDCIRGEKCMPWANDGCMRWNATRCSPVTDQPDQPGESCMVEGSPFTGIDSCDIGSMCLGVDLETNEGTCIAMCVGDSSNPLCEQSDASCFIDEDQFLVLCLPGCDPLGDDCGPSARCIPTEQSLGCFPVWGAGAAAGQSCEYLEECGPGLFCGAPDAVAPSCDPGSSGCCTPWCDLSAPDPSAACFDPAQQCIPWWDSPAPEGYEDLGVCRVVAP